VTNQDNGARRGRPTVWGLSNGQSGLPSTVIWGSNMNKLDITQAVPLPNPRWACRRLPRNGRDPKNQAKSQRP
jgi:hypothetical protein